MFRINGPVPALVHLELESSSHLGIPEDLLRCNVLLRHQSGLPVHTVLMLLRPRANASDQTGVYTGLGADGRPVHQFWYTVVRVWEESIDGLLAAGVGLASLALLTNEADADLGAAFVRFQDRLRTESIPDTVTRTVFGSALVLSGLRHHQDRMAEVLRNMAVNMEESSVHQWILRKGRVQEAVAVLLRQGQKRFGAADDATSARLRTIDDVDRLERMTDRIFDATDWVDLLGTE